MSMVHCLLTLAAWVRYDVACSVVMRKFKKTPHTYYTGKDKIELAGSLARYHGDKVTNETSIPQT